MFFEASFAVPAHALAETLLAFAATFEGRIDRLSIVNADLRSREWAPKPERIAEILAYEEPVRMLSLFERRPAGEPNEPKRSVTSDRVPSMGDGPETHVIRVYGPEEEEPRLAPLWWQIATEAGFKAGNGYRIDSDRSGIYYSMMVANAVHGRDAIWEAFNRAADRHMRDAASFRPVVEGRMLRNVLRHNFMTAALAEEVRDILREAGLPEDGFVRYPPDRVVWTIEDTDTQRAAHSALHERGLVWEDDWLDLERSAPASGND